MEKGKNMTGISQRSANILSEGKREIRAINDVCDPSCFVWFACANSKPNDVCKGFILLDGESRKLINRNLTEDDAIYVGNCVRTIQRGCEPETKETLVPEILRFLSPEYPAICSKECPYVQCSSWGTPEMEGKPCRNRVPTNEELKHPQPETIQRNAEAILENIPRNSKLGSIMDRLEKIEEQVTILEKMDTEPQKAIERYHIFPKRPELCKPKRDDE
jgi:hypothetical protein